jgi:hypothetical protein
VPFKKKTASENASAPRNAVAKMQRKHELVTPEQEKARRDRMTNQMNTRINKIHTEGAAAARAKASSPEATVNHASSPKALAHNFARGTHP